MFVSLQPFVYSVFNSFRNDRKITVSQVEEQFLERASYLYPRVVPAHDAVDAFFVRYIFNDVAGMFQRKLRFVTLHGENAAVTFGQKGYVRQDVYERFGSNAWARIMARSADGSSGRANGRWSPDSVWESGCIEFNN